MVGFIRRCKNFLHRLFYLFIDFYQPSFYFEAHPSSAFNKTYIIAIKTSDDRKTISDRVFKIFSGDAVVYVEDDMSDKRRDQILEEEFYLKNFKE